LVLALLSSIFVSLVLALPPPTGFFTLSLHDALPIFVADGVALDCMDDLGFLGAKVALAPDPIDRLVARHIDQPRARIGRGPCPRSEEHTSELQSHLNLVCRLLLEKKKIQEKT